MASLYIQDILMPEEQILHYAKVHYVLYAPGVLLMLLAVFSVYYMPAVSEYFGLFKETHESVMGFTKFGAVTSFMAGIALVLRAWLKIYSTEVVITDQRVIVKVGISTATTAEIDRKRISSVIVHKPLLGRIFNYGWVSILGYSGDINGLPVLAKPHEIQKYIYKKM